MGGRPGRGAHRQTVQQEHKRFDYEGNRLQKLNSMM